MKDPPSCHATPSERKQWGNASFVIPGGFALPSLQPYEKGTPSTSNVAALCAVGHSNLAQRYRPQVLWPAEDTVRHCNRSAALCVLIF